MKFNFGRQNLKVQFIIVQEVFLLDVALLQFFFIVLPWNLKETEVETSCNNFPVWQLAPDFSLFFCMWWNVWSLWCDPSWPSRLSAHTNSIPAFVLEDKSFTGLVLLSLLAWFVGLQGLLPLSSDPANTGVYSPPWSWLSAIYDERCWNE